MRSRYEVGTFWRRPSPRDPAIIEEGAAVTAGTTIGLVEVMKTFAPLKAGAEGRIVRFLVADGAAVQAGAAVAVIRG